MASNGGFRRPGFPGQLERLDFDLAQLEALASPTRSEVFWSFAKDQPLAVADVADAIGKSRQSVHYHVNALVEVGLLIVVGERKRGVRNERLYVQAARAFYSLGRPGEAGPIVRGFLAMTRTMAREYEALQGVYESEPEFRRYGLFRRVSLRLGKERAALLKQRLKDLADELMAMESDPEGVRVNFSFLITPALGEARRRLDSRSEQSEGEG